MIVEYITDMRKITLILMMLLGMVIISNAQGIPMPEIDQDCQIGIELPDHCGWDENGERLYEWYQIETCTYYVSLLGVRLYVVDVISTRHVTQECPTSGIEALSNSNKEIIQINKIDETIRSD